ncbi:ML domain [Popillia japonica]|uniref:ML domain n=1 Tax=Popillia japonica TaxID=7064 RepID=A0AAW1KIE6_POPJA
MTSFKFKFSVLLIAGLFFTGCSATNVRSCDNGTPRPLSTDIANCKTMPCNIVRGATVVMDIIFENPRYTETTRPKAVAFALGQIVDYPLGQTNGCQGFTNIRCPIDPGDRVRYHFELNVLSLYPKISFELTFSLLDESEKEIFCFVVDAQVVD